MNATLLAELHVKAQELSDKYKATVILAFEVWHHDKCGPSHKARVHMIRGADSVANFECESLEEMETRLEIELSVDAIEKRLRQQIAELEEKAARLKAQIQ